MSDIYPRPSKAELKVPAELRRQWEQYRTERDRLRAEIRARANYRLKMLTGISASMYWTDDEFLYFIVQRLDCGLFGWPADLPFQNLSSLEGGVVPLQRLLKLWKRGELRLVKLTEADRMKAINSPRSFLPNPALRPTKKPRVETVDVPAAMQHVLHPYDLHAISPSPAVDTELSQRRQRSDTKKPHCRKLRYVRGVQTPAYVYEAPVEFAQFDMSCVAFSEYPV